MTMAPDAPAIPENAASIPTPGLHQGRLRTHGMTEADARQSYLDWLDGIVDTTFLQPFAAEMDSYRIGGFSVVHLAATARLTTRNSASIAQDGYYPIGIQYVASGRATGDANGREVVSDPGTVMVLDYGQPFSITDLEPRTVVNVAVARDLFPDTAGDPADHHGTVLKGPAATILGGYMDHLGRVLAELPAASGTSLARVFTELLTLPLAVGAADVAQGGTGRNARTIRRAELLIAEHIGAATLGPAWLADRLNVSRSELYAVMEPFGGVARFILHQRLHRARAAIESPTETRRIGAIAYAFGFTSEAHFARAFRAVFGMTATEARRRSTNASSKK